MLRSAGIEVSLDDSAKAAAEKLNEAFIHFMKYWPAACDH